LLQRLVAQAPFKVQQVLTDNGKAFTDRCCATGERAPTGRHRFDRACEQHGINHRLIKLRHPQTHGMVERFNGRISAVLGDHPLRCGPEPGGHPEPLCAPV
jgi:transposase InsO family protein